MGHALLRSRTVTASRSSHRFRSIRLHAAFTTLFALWGCGGGAAQGPTTGPGSAPGHEEVLPTPYGVQKPRAPSPSPGSIVTLRHGETVSLDGGEQVTITGIVAESIAASPTDPAAYPEGSGVTAELSVAGERVRLVKLSPGYQSKAVAWAGTIRTELVDGDDRAVRVAIERVSAEIDESTRVALTRGSSQRLFGREELKFLGHSHKAVAPGQGESPLIVEYAIDGEVAYQSVFPAESRTWPFHDLQLTLEDYVYGERMELVVRRMKLVPALRR
jgi:hypothetical protein